MVRSGREQTYTVGKDTGNYWDAGAANVHWVIATDTQVEAGVRQALERVQSEVVLIEGNSFTQYVAPDFFIMVIRRDGKTIKRTARNAMDHASVLYVSGEGDCTEKLNEKAPLKPDTGLPIFSIQTFSLLIEKIQQRLEKSKETKLCRVAS